MAEHFHRLTVREIVPETDEANSIRFDVPPELAAPFRFRAGQHLTLRADIGGEDGAKGREHGADCSSQRRPSGAATSSEPPAIADRIRVSAWMLRSS